MTDASKALVWDAVYRPFGAVETITGSASNNLRFPGQYFLLESGLHYNWHRHYDPTLGRYLRPDPLGFVDGPSLFGYALSSPAMYVDPTGQYWQIGTGVRIAGRYVGRIAKAAAKFCFGKDVFLNRNQYLRIGIGRRSGDWVFRAAGKWVPGGKIDIYTIGPINKPVGPRPPKPPK